MRWCCKCLLLADLKTVNVKIMVPITFIYYLNNNSNQRTSPCTSLCCTGCYTEKEEDISIHIKVAQSVIRAYNCYWAYNSYFVIQREFSLPRKYGTNILVGLLQCGVLHLPMKTVQKVQLGQNVEARLQGGITYRKYIFPVLKTSALPVCSNPYFKHWICPIKPDTSVPEVQPSPIGSCLPTDTEVILKGCALCGCIPEKGSAQ